jgi:hypothetical protein
MISVLAADIPVDTPRDHLDPQWDQAGMVHDWRNHVSDEIMEMWDTFTPEQRAALARQAQKLASAEEWE